MARFELSTDYWPLFVTVVPTEFSVADVDVYITAVDALYERKERFATLVETSATATMPGAAERRRLADWQNATIGRIQSYNVFTATVIRSPLIRGAMTAMNWVFRPPNEQIVCSEFDEAFTACVARLGADGAAFSSSLTQLAASGPKRVEELLSRRPTSFPRSNF